MRQIDNDTTNWKSLEYCLGREYTKYLIEHFPEIKNMDWISVKDELPKETYIPMAYAEYSSLVLAKQADEIIFAYTQNGKWYNFFNKSDDDKEVNQNITHWAYLP